MELGIKTGTEQKIDCWESELRGSLVRGADGVSVLRTWQPLSPAAFPAFPYGGFRARHLKSRALGSQADLVPFRHSQAQGLWG